MCVIVHDPRPYVYQTGVPRVADIIDRRDLRGWSGYKIISQAEVETLETICDVPIIDISDFYDWEAKTFPSMAPPKKWWQRLINMEKE